MPDGDANVTDQTTTDTATTDVKAGAGGGSMFVPAKDAPAQDWDAFYRHVGRPDNFEGYDIGDVSAASDQDKAVAKTLCEAAWKSGLSKSQFASLHQALGGVAAETAKQRSDAASKAAEAGMADLTKTWGGAAEDRLKAVDRALTKALGPEGMKRLVEVGLANDPGFIKGMYSFVEAAGEDRLGPVNRTGGNMTPQQAQNELEKLGLDPEHQKAKWDKNHPGHTAALKREAGLYEQMSGEPGALTGWLDEMAAGAKPTVRVG